MKKYDDAYVAVRMLPSVDGRKAKTILNPHGEKRIAFFRTIVTGKNVPKPDEVWICLLVEDTGHHNESGGILRVDPIRRVSNPEAAELLSALGNHKKLRDADGIPVRVSRHVVTECLYRPEIAAVLRGAIASIRMRMLPGRGLHLPLPEPFATEDIVETAKIDIDEPALFAHRHGKNVPIRVSHVASPPMTNDLFLWFIKGKDWLLSHVSSGGNESPGEPTAFENRENENVLNFWLKHAHVFKPELMQTPFYSTWREVLEEGREATEPTGTELPEYHKEEDD